MSLVLIIKLILSLVWWIARGVWSAGALVYYEQSLG